MQCIIDYETTYTCSVLGSSEQERQGEGPVEAHRDDEGSGASLLEER